MSLPLSLRNYGPVSPCPLLETTGYLKHIGVTTLQTITLADAEKLTGTKANTIYRKLKRNGVTVSKNRHNQLEIPTNLVLPETLARSLVRIER